ncbi:hypothetical protein HDU82_002821 [Entophlyctis luteolus]|nr:hypothetical protein HDU82_002821 [Entophlyctis luteolus]
MSSSSIHARPSEQLARVPSSDGVVIDARIGMPPSASNNPVSATAAIPRRPDVCLMVTHPYGRLGGNLHNNVVDAVVRAFGYSFITVRFNFRGVGQSSGRPSVSGKGELDDLLCVWRYVRDRADLRPRFFIVVGYSYGCIPVCAAAAEIEGCIGVVAISFPASVMWFLTMGNSNKYLDALKQLPSSVPKLFIMGSRDNFTALKSFNQFVSSIPERKHVDIVDGADHFWFENESVVVEAIRKWIRQERVVPDRPKGTPLPSVDSLWTERIRLQEQRQMQIDRVGLRSARSAESLGASGVPRRDAGVGDSWKSEGNLAQGRDAERAEHTRRRREEDEQDGQPEAQHEGPQGAGRDGREQEDGGGGKPALQQQSKNTLVAGEI